jgi:hypothetical protein
LFSAALGVTEAYGGGRNAKKTNTLYVENGVGLPRTHLHKAL